MMTNLLQDLKFSLRLIIQRPAFSIVAITTLALGSGANVAVFTVANAVLLQPLPFREPARLIQVWNEFRGADLEEIVFSHVEFRDYRTRVRRLDDLAAYGRNTHTVRIDTVPENMWIVSVSTNVFDLLGVKPALGRTFAEHESQPGQSEVVLISHTFWQERYGGDGRVLDRTLLVDGVPHTIVGVMPQGLRFVLEPPDIWKPIVFAGPLVEEPQRGSRSLWMIGRLRDGVTPADAQVEFTMLARQLASEHAGQYPAELGHAIAVVPLHEQVTGRAQGALLILFGAASLVLLLSCANMANLLLARGTSRERELAMRAALGASRSRLLRELLTESVVLSIAGGAAGILLAMWAVGGLLALAPSGTLPRMEEIAITRTVVGYSVGLALLAGVLSGLPTALSLSRPDWRGALQLSRGHSGTPSRVRLRRMFVVLEIGLAVVLVIAAGLMLRSFARVVSVPPGFNPDRALTVRVGLPIDRYPTRLQQAGVFDSLSNELGALPGVERVGLVTSLPFSGWSNDWTLTLDETAAPAARQRNPNANYFAVNADYFAAMEIPIRSGRGFTPSDARGGPVALVNETLARRFWPDRSPIGRRLKMGGSDSPWPWRTIVGVVGDVRQSNLETAVMPELFVPYDDERKPVAASMFVVVRSAADPVDLAMPVRTALASLDSALAAADIRSLAERVSLTLAERQYQLLLLVAFGGVALALAAVGAYGVLAHLVSRRTREIGLRLALGAREGDLFLMVVRDGMRLAGLGIGAGLIAALAVTRFEQPLLYETSPTDPLIFGTVALLLAIVAFMASAVPAWRAMRVEPMMALRVE